MIRNVQTVRLVDILIYGPFLIWVGARKSDLPQWVKRVLITMGGSTIAYNAVNYLRDRQK